MKKAININDPKNALACMKLIKAMNTANKDYAEYSEDKLYRYVLKRHTPNMWWSKSMVFVMLNPSTATEFKNDPTVRRCMSFAEREGCTDLYVVNLFAFRATDPKRLLKCKDPVGPMNDKKIEEIVNKVSVSNGIIVAAWGSHPIAKKRGEEFCKNFGPINFDFLMCLGKTKNGAPRHPLYVKSSQPLEIYR